MTLEEAKQRVEAIRAMADDPEAAHAAEDALYGAFVAMIAETTTDAGGPTAAAQIATVILTTVEIPFSRWYA